MPNPNFLLVWDEPTKRMYETGVSNMVLYPQADNGTYPIGEAWNGITAFTESPSGADETALYADNIKYLSIRAAENIGATIEAYYTPDLWLECDGLREIAPGVVVSQQVRKSFGLAYKTILGNDVQDNDYSYKLHIFYNLTASPSERGYQSVNESPEAMTLSWELASTPITMPNGLKASALITLDASKADPDKLAAIEQILYGTAGVTTYSATEDTAPQSGKTYYTRSGSEGAYVYTEFTGSTFESGVTYYEKSVTGEIAARLPLPDELYAILTAQG